MKTGCRICGAVPLDEWLDFGAQALTNRFLHSANEEEYTHPLAVGVCRQCATVQLRDRVPVEQMRPRFDWISYNEPEGHLDELAKVISQLPGLSTNSAISGLTYKDESTLRRLQSLGFQGGWLADMKSDLGVDHPFSGIESVQANLTPATANHLIEKHGRPDVLLFRHVLEHSHDIAQSLAFLKSVVAPDGYIVFEMPDARRALERLDYSTVWEEHLFYFTPQTLQYVLERAGFEVVFLESYFYTLENSLVAIVRPGASHNATPFDRTEELRRAQHFIHGFRDVRWRHQQLLRDLRDSVGRIAFLGAGHLSAAFICLYGLDNDIDLVVDDNPKKQGLFMPGSHLPILPSSALIERDVQLCLMGVRPEIEDAVCQKNRAFLDRGGRLLSIFPDSRYSLFAHDGHPLKKVG